MKFFYVLLGMIPVLDEGCGFENRRFEKEKLMARSIIVFIFLAFVCLPLVAGSSSGIKIYPIDSDEYTIISDLYVMQGLSLPSTAGPWSGDELSKMLDRINYGKLSVEEQSLYRFISDELSRDLPSSSLKAEVALETYVHTNTETFTENEDWYYNYEKRTPLLDVPFEVSLANLFYGYAAFGLSLQKYDEVDSATEATSSQYGTSYFSNNVAESLVPQFEDFDINIPYRAFGALGGEGWAFQVGRDQLSWGSGITGNFILGSQIQYHNMGRFTAYSPTFKYTFVTSFFPHPEEIWGDDEFGYTQGRSITGLKMFMGHRFEGRYLNQRLGVAVNEGIMYQSEDGDFDLRVLNPFMLYHNYYIRSNANSIISLELDFVPAPRWNVYAQIVVDEYAVPTENTKKNPNALGYMLGLKNVRPLNDGIFYGILEGVYTDPSLYLRSADGKTEQKEDDESDSLNYVVALRYWLDNSVLYDQSFMGYQYGGDAIVGTLVLGFEKYRNWSLEGRLFYMVHGDNDETSLWSFTDNTAKSPTGVATHSFDLGLTGSKWWGSALKFSGGLDLLASIQDGDADFDVQLALSLCYSSN
jgi:hypothetical protein